MVLIVDLNFCVERPHAHALSLDVFACGLIPSGTIPPARRRYWTSMSPVLNSIPPRASRTIALNASIACVFLPGLLYNHLRSRGRLAGRMQRGQLGDKSQRCGGE